MSESTPQPTSSSRSAEEKRLDALCEHQRRSAARGCAIALVCELAALLAAILWIVSWFFDYDRLQLSAAVAFGAFTLVAVLITLYLVIAGNTPAQRRLRRGQRELRNEH